MRPTCHVPFDCEPAASDLYLRRLWTKSEEKHGVFGYLHFLKADGSKTQYDLFEMQGHIPRLGTYVDALPNRTRSFIAWLMPFLQTVN